MPKEKYFITKPIPEYGLTVNELKTPSDNNAVPIADMEPDFGDASTGEV